MAFGGRRTEVYVAVWRCVAGAVPVRTTKYYSARQYKIFAIKSRVLVRTTRNHFRTTKYYSVYYKESFPYNKRGALVWVRCFCDVGVLLTVASGIVGNLWAHAMWFSRAKALVGFAYRLALSRYKGILWREAKMQNVPVDTCMLSSTLTCGHFWCVWCSGVQKNSVGMTDSRFWGDMFWTCFVFGVTTCQHPSPKPKAPENPKRCFGTNTSLCMLALTFGLSPYKPPVPNLKSPSPKPKAPENPKRCFGTNTSLCMLALTSGLSPYKPPVPNLKSPSPKPKAPENPKRCFGTNTSLCMLALTFGLSPYKPPVPNLKPPSPKAKAPENPKRCFGTNTSLCMLDLTFGLSPYKPPVPNLKPQKTLNAVLGPIHHFVC